MDKIGFKLIKTIRQDSAGGFKLLFILKGKAEGKAALGFCIGGVISVPLFSPMLLHDFDKAVKRKGHVNKPGMVNSVNEEGTKCETIFPIIAGTPWNVVGLTCDQDGIPADPKKKVEIAKRIIDKADHYGVALENLHIDPCVMALATMPTAMEDFAYCIRGIHAYAPQVKVTGAISNISFNMPARKYVNMGCMTMALEAGLDSAIMDPTSRDMMGALHAAAALSVQDKGGRKYNRAYRKGLFG